MQYWIMLILIINVLAIIFDPKPLVRINSGIVSIIAIVALIRVYKKKRSKDYEKLYIEYEQLVKDNKSLKKELHNLGLEIWFIEGE